MRNISFRELTRGLGARALSLSALALAFAPRAQADGVQVVLAGSHIQRVTSGTTTVGAEQLITGTSSGQVSPLQAPDFPVLSADDLNLASYFARTSTADPRWDVDLGSWWDSNGTPADFFVFEIGGNDALQVAALFDDGSAGQSVPVSGWTSTGYTVVTGPFKNQMVHGLAFRASDLRKANGAPLAPGERIAGVRLISGAIDGAVFAAVDPVPPTTVPPKPKPSVELLGPAYKWSPLEIRFIGGPTLSALGDSPNPFLDLRLQATFTSEAGRTYEVPGFFDGNGRDGDVGSVWKARFTPPVDGAWTVQASLRAGTDVAVSLLPNAGQPVYFDGATLAFDVQPVPASARGFHRKGVLRTTGSHYLRFDDRSWFLKGGTDSPENLLAYFSFDEVADSGNLGILHRYVPHRVHWSPGDPDWNSATTGEDAHGLIGALNYLSSQGVNSVYMMLMNLGGDGQDVCPFVGQSSSAFDKTHYDLARLRQWDSTFRHAQELGILLHCVLAETEPANEGWLDGGQLGTQRKLFFREMVARFAHHNAIKWNLCEENDWPKATLDAFADHLLALDAYDHPIAVHNHPDDLSQYSVLAGDVRFAMTSAQYTPDQAGSQVETLRNLSKQAGHPWAVELDENLPPNSGLQPGNADDLRKRALWDAYFSGAAGVEWYFGYNSLPSGGDLDVEDFATREPMWRYMRHARTFIEVNLPFHQMSPRDALLSGESGGFGGGEVFAQKGEVYAVYFPSAASTGSLDLSEAPGVTFDKRWFNPRTGLLEGPLSSVPGGGALSVGPPPSSPSEDWVLWLKRK